MPTLKLVVVKYVDWLRVSFYFNARCILMSFNSAVVFIGYHRYIEIKGPLEQQVVCQELKSLYAICYSSIEATEKSMETYSPDPTSPISPYIVKFYGTYKN